MLAVNNYHSRHNSCFTRVVVVLAISLLLTVACAQKAVDCSVAARGGGMARIFKRLRNEVTNKRKLAAAFLRAAFHDCITATRQAPESGCNGSLQFELSRRGNNRLDPAIEVIKTARKTVRNGMCVSMADAIQIAMAAGLRVVADIRPRRFNDDIPNKVLRFNGLWDAKIPRVDADSADPDGLLPSGGWSEPSQITNFYNNLGFSTADAFISTAGGHAIGSIGNRPFTPQPDVFTTLYAQNLVRLSITKTDDPNFNLLPSDRAIILHPSGLRIMERMSGLTKSPANGDAELTFDTRVGLIRLEHRFIKFLLRMSRLTGQTVGNSALLNSARV